MEAAQGEGIQYATASEDLPAEEGVQSGKQNLEALLKGASGSEDSEEDGDSEDDMDALRMLGRAKSAMPGSGTSSANPAGQIDATTLSTIVQMELLQELRGRKKTVWRNHGTTDPTARSDSDNFQCTLVEGFNPYKRLFTKKKDSYLQKKRLICEKKDPYLQKKKTLI